LYIRSAAQTEAQWMSHAEKQEIAVDEESFESFRIG
jgi:hypothetical protein